MNRITFCGQVLPIPEPNRVIEITPILHGAEIIDWLYHFGEDYDQKLTTKELQEKLKQNEN